MPRSLLAVLTVGLLLSGSVRAADDKEKPKRTQQCFCDTVRLLIEMSGSEPACAEELQQIYDQLRKLDKGNTGKIDPEALKAEGDRILRQRLQDVFTRLDTNKDGKISKEEARGLIKEHFDRLDTNKDGFIAFDELLKAAKERRERPPTENKPTTNPPKEKEKK